MLRAILEKVSEDFRILGGEGEEFPSFLLLGYHLPVVFPSFEDKFIDSVSYGLIAVLILERGKTPLANGNPEGGRMETPLPHHKKNSEVLADLFKDLAGQFGLP